MSVSWIVVRAALAAAAVSAALATDARAQSPRSDGHDPWIPFLPT
ncbi:MAG TPA: hypothetical protein VH165_15680 [Kofleriaceae bacterium]|jgi:hypothetical protein|nr:hypothetical protein [Kofleriaceae bacterium]